MAIEFRDVEPCDPVDDPKAYDRLREASKKLLQLWIGLMIQPAKTANLCSSYGLKHEFEALTGIYVTNGQFKGAMLKASYEPVKETDKNWKFRIRPKFKRKRGESCITMFGLPPQGVADEEMRQIAEQALVVKRKP